MNKFEDISAFMDGESDRPLEAVLGSIKSDAELRDTWRRYHLIGDSLRRQLPEQVPATDLSSRISQALDSEPAILSPQSRTRTLPQRLLKPAAGMAIAASVALVAIVGLRALDQTTGTGTAVNAGSSVAAGQPVETVVAEPGNGQLQQSMQPAQISPLARTVSTDAELATGGYQQSPAGQYRFNSYLINHNEYRANAGVRGSMPYARIVAPDDNNQ